MYLIQLLLPLYDNDQQALPRALFDQLRRELLARFGGLTAHTRAPLSGLWEENRGQTVRDDLVIYEVMLPVLDRVWWRRYRRLLERRFRQQSLVVRAHELSLL